jgi:hypothetical protein
LSIFCASCNDSNHDIHENIISEQNQTPPAPTANQQNIPLSFFGADKSFNSGTAHRMNFTNDIVTITFERYYDGQNREMHITGKYKIVNNNQLEINWDDNKIEYLNTFGGSCGGLQTVIQSYTFPANFSVDDNKNTVTALCVFSQSFKQGTRCGDETKSENTEFEFDLVGN